MNIQKRTLPMYIFLNCITLGIYGFVVARQMNAEINALCNGDGEEPHLSYTATTFLKAIPLFGIPVYGAYYYNYYWYQQANRLKLNANRYGIEVKESGTDVILMRTLFSVVLFAVTVFETIAAFIIPGIIVLLFSLITPVLGIIFAAIFIIIFYLFRSELTIGANVSNYYMMKNLNRFADVYRNGATSFDPMAYEYYPSIANNYPNRGFSVGNVDSVGMDQVAVVDENNDDTTGFVPRSFTRGCLLGVKGTCAGYNFDLTSGEEIVIGKDAKVSSVVIDPAYKEISRKHVSVCFDAISDQYRVVDYSSNGTWVNGTRLIRGQENYFTHGAELKLANDKNTFRLV